MEDSAFSDDFCRFLQTTVPSVEAAELLLHLFRQPQRQWTVQELVLDLPAGVRLTESEATRCLDTFRAQGLIVAGPDPAIQYLPSAEGDPFVRTLAQAYNERPVTLIRMIYALRDSRIQSFADAFKFRKR